MNTVIYDLDGTLVDTKNGILEGIGKSITEIFPEKFINFALIKIGPSIGEIIESLFPELEKRQVDQIINKFRIYYDEVGWKKSTPYEGVFNVLEYMSKSKINQYIVTNKPHKVTRLILAFFELDRYIQDVICPDMDIPYSRTKRDMLSFVLEKHRIINGDAIYVGDTQSDARAAYQCGLSFGAAQYGYGNFSGMEEEFPTIYLSKITDLMTILKQ